MTETQDGVKFTLDCAQAAFISSDKLVISLRGGELYVTCYSSFLNQYLDDDIAW